MSDLNRKENESFFEWKLRLSLMKLNHEIDEDWQELIDILGLDMSPCHYRKISYGYKEYDEYIKSKTKEMIAEEEYQKLLDKEIQLKKEKIKIRDMKNQLNKQIREQARHESVEEILKNKLDDFEPQVIEYKEVKNNGKSAIALWSDWHYGIEVDSVINKFNPDICRERVKRLVNKTITHCKTHDIDELHVFIAGDIISAENYNIIRLQNRENLIDQIINASDLLTQSLIEIAKHIPKIKIGICTGNHCRSHEKGNADNRDNYIHLIRRYVELGVSRVENIEFHVNHFDDEIIDAKINGLSVIATHGDKVSKTNPSYKLAALLDEKIDLLLLGHWHEARMETNHRTIVEVNGSIVSSDQYARNMNLFAYPTQKLLIIGDQEVECVYNIRLDK